MGRTLPSVTQVFLREQESFMRFRRALRRSDQKALDDLFAAAHKHLAAAAYASHALPFEVFLLSMLLEEHKQVLRLRYLLSARDQAALQQLEQGDSTAYLDSLAASIDEAFTMPLPAPGEAGSLEGPQESTEPKPSASPPGHPDEGARLVDFHG
jgi:hypothetical protein